MDDHEHENYELFNPESFICPHCEDVTDSEDWNSEQECCRFCADPEENIEDDDDYFDDEIPESQSDYVSSMRKPEYMGPTLSMVFMLVLIMLFWYFFSTLGDIIEMSRDAL